MTPHYADDWLTVWQGDCREVMAQMEPESVHTVVTSPPYWGLRDYGIGGQLGLEPTPEEYVKNMVEVFREVRRVLRADGTCWVNLGDSYAQSANTGGTASIQGSAKRVGAMNGHTRSIPDGLKPKDLVGIPWRVAFALQADGWYLRSDIIWSKPNPMPESVTDRPTTAHEYLFLLSKSPRYYYDADAVREPHTSIEKYGVSGTAEWRDNLVPRTANGKLQEPSKTMARGNLVSRAPDYVGHANGRNLRNVWTIATQPYPGAHFATFPEKLVEPCVKAGTSERGVCPECGAPWRRVVERIGERSTHGANAVADAARGTHEATSIYRTAVVPITQTTGWQPSCAHDAIPVPAVVLDPFAGSGTTGRVAQRLGRRAVLIDLSGEYLVQAMNRNHEIPLGLETA